MATSRKKFCCVCGKAGDFESYTCPACNAAYSAVPRPPSKTLKQQQEEASRTIGCRRCGRLLVRGRWSPYSPELVKSDNLRLITCPDCQKVITGYYEAIIQFSTKSGNFEKSKPEIEKMLQNLIKSEENCGKMVEITKIEKNNYFFNNASAAKKIARTVAAAYNNARITETFKLVGFDRSTSKEKRRVTILIAL